MPPAQNVYAHLGKVIDRVVAGSLFHWTFVVFAVLHSLEHPCNSIQRSDINYVEIPTASFLLAWLQAEKPKDACGLVEVASKVSCYLDDSGWIWSNVEDINIINSSSIGWLDEVGCVFLEFLFFWRLLLKRPLALLILCSRCSAHSSKSNRSWQKCRMVQRCRVRQLRSPTVSSLHSSTWADHHNHPHAEQAQT